MNILFIRKYAWLIVLHGFLNSSLLNRADKIAFLGVYLFALNAGSGLFQFDKKFDTGDWHK